MKIGLSTLVLQRGQSGVGQYVLALARALLAHADTHEFTLFVLEEDLPLFAFAGDRLRLLPVTEAVRPPIKNILWHQTELPRLTRRLGLDVLHVPSYRRLLWSRPCTLVGTIHDLAPFRLPKKYDPARMWYGRVVVRQLARRQHALIAVSQTTARDIHAFYQIPPERVTVIHNGLDHARFSPGKQIEAKVFAARHGVLAPGFLARFFLYLARLEHPAKNHVRLIEAFDRFKAQTRLGWQLVLGGSDWHGAGVIHEAARRSPFARDIHFLGFVPDADVPTWYRAADVFVYPSLHEGFGLPPVEAMACGTPVLCSAQGALGEIIGTAAARMDPTSIPDMTRQLIRLATDGELRDQLRAAGLVQARRFDWNQTAAATVEAYEHAAACTQPAAARPDSDPPGVTWRTRATRIFRHLP